MKAEISPRGKVTIHFTPADERELGLDLPAGKQFLTNHWKESFLWLHERGVDTRKALMFLRRGGHSQAFWRTLRLAQRYRTGSSLNMEGREVRIACGHPLERETAFTEEGRAFFRGNREPWLAMHEARGGYA